jgi:hypothetical protein
MDARGSPFAVHAETADISCTGARLKDLSGMLADGQKVEVQCRDQKATFRVQWQGEKGSPQMGQAGLRCLEPGKYIWGVAPKEWEADTYDPSKPAPAGPPPAPAALQPARAASSSAPAPAKSRPAAVSAYVATASFGDRDRRQFVRHTCRIAAQITLEDGSLRLAGTITDISLGGCYIEMFSPLPVDTFAEVYIFAGDDTLHLSARVRSSQRGAGMGVSFTGMSPEDFEKLQKLAPSDREERKPEPPKPAVKEPAAPSAPRVDSRPPAAPQFDSSELPATPELFAAVIRVLLRRGLLTRAELLEELEKMKVPHV